MSAVPILEAVPVLDTVQFQPMHTFKVDQGRNYSYMFNFEQVRFQKNWQIIFVIIILGVWALCGPYLDGRQLAACVCVG